MERTRRPCRAPAVPAARRLAAAVVLVAAPVLAGCSAGFDATSTQPYAASDGINADSGHISVLNALVVASDPVTTGVISTTIANRDDRDDRITDITSPDATVALTGTRDLPAGSTVLLGSGTDTSATLTSLTRRPGETITLEFSFAGAEPVTLRTVVVAATGDYAQLTPPASPSP